MSWSEFFHRQQYKHIMYLLPQQSNWNYTNYYIIVSLFRGLNTGAFLYSLSASCRVTHGKLTDEIDCLRLLTTSSIVDQSQLRKFYSEIVSLCSKMGLEFEALSRYGDLTTQHCTMCTVCVYGLPGKEWFSSYLVIT